ncbi:MAG TPA: tRNA-dihydrouridine synthase [Burkholderiales bacterium]|nr:tRNA-dihydrouridine synthase [Burkholderiales bacterium]
MLGSIIFQSLTINRVEFRKRILRSSVGGRCCNYDGTVTDVWKNFEKRFADAGVGAVISTTFHVNRWRLSPFQYPSIAEDHYVPYLKKYIPQIKHGNDCRFIMQIGDPGYATYSSLFPQEADTVSSSAGFDLAFGYGSTRRSMSAADIERSIAEYAAAARRVREAGADGVEVTATKGYLIHQFLNPGINCRDDEWGGDADRRFRFLEEIVREIRRAVGADYLFGIRLSGADFNYSPLALALARLPSPFLSRARWMGNDLPQMLEYGRRLQALGVDYLHVVSGYGFPNPRDVPGAFPFDEVRMFFDSVRHLSGKAAIRAALLHVPPAFLWRWLLGIGWRFRSAANLDFARAFKQALPGMTVIANGGFQERDLIEQALDAGDCDMVSMARALIANPDLVHDFERGRNAPEKPCSHCNKCVGRTGTSPLGCYDRSRFASWEEMEKQILDWNRGDPP